MHNNNFKRLEEMETERIPPPPPQIKDSVHGTMGVFKFVGQIVDMYMPKVFDMLVTMVGGTLQSTPGRVEPHEPPGAESDPPSGPAQ